MSAQALQEFFVSLGFEVDTSKIKEFEQQTASLRESMLKVSAIATGAAVGLGMMVMKVAEGMDDVGDFADIVGMSAREVAALGKVADQNDSSMAAMKSTIQGLAAVTGEAALGIGRGAMVFEKLGLSAKDAEGKTKGAADMLGEIADRMKDMTAGERLALGSKLHIDPSLIPLLSKGSAAFRELKESAEAANPLTDEQYAQADEIVKLWNKATAGVSGYTKLLAAKLFPVMKKILTAYNDWVSSVKKGGGGVIANAFKAASDFAEVLWDWIVRLSTGMKSAYDWMMQFKGVVWAAGAAVAALIAYQAGLFFNSLRVAVAKATAALLGMEAATVLPVVLIGLLGLAIALVVDDLVNFYEGNESVLGQLLEEFPNAGKVAVVTIGAISAAFVALKWDALSAWAATMWGAVRSAVVTVAAAAAMSGGILPLIGMYVSMAASALAAGMAAAGAWLVAIAPIALVLAAIAAVAVAIYELWVNWDTVIAWLSDAWGTVTTTLKSAFDGVMSVFDAAKQKVMGFIDSVVGAIGKVGQLLGLTGKDQSVNVKQIKSAVAQSPAIAGAAPSLSAAPGASASPMSTGGMMGRAENNVSNAATTTQNTTINAPITINSPDPAKAGEAVGVELDRRNKQAVRNGQTAVAL